MSNPTDRCGARTKCILRGIDVCALPVGHEGSHRTSKTETGRECSWPQGPGWEPESPSVTGTDAP